MVGTENVIDTHIEGVAMIRYAWAIATLNITIVQHRRHALARVRNGAIVKVATHNEGRGFMRLNKAHKGINLL